VKSDEPPKRGHAVLKFRHVIKFTKWSRDAVFRIFRYVKNGNLKDIL
jgi:hypothetical protein